MRFSKAWTVASKDLKTFTRKRNILYSMIYFEAFVSIGMPFIIHFISTKAARVAIIPVFLNAFSFWFAIGAALLPVGIASYSLIGEKVQKSLEPLLATPTTDSEILLGKSMAAFLPAIGANVLGAAIFCVLTDLFTRNVLGYTYYPNWNIVIVVLLVGPLACLMSIGYNILISSRATDIRAAQQLGTLIIIPMAAVYLLSEIQVFELSTQNLLIIAAIIAVIDILLLFLVRATFQREEILAKWK